MDWYSVYFGVLIGIILWVALWALRRWIPSRTVNSSAYGIWRIFIYAGIAAALVNITLAISLLISYWSVYGVYTLINRPAKA